MNIKTIIFDLGGVIIDLDFMATPKAFSSLTGLPAAQIMSHYQDPGLFQQYEKGMISDADLRAGINDLFGMSLTDEQIDTAWNAMLGAIDPARLQLMNQLRQSYKVVILSNTNGIHERAFNQTLMEVSGKDSLHHFADEVYFSHEMHMRKPDLEIYQSLLLQTGNRADECLFLDDTLANLESAASLGIQTMHITKPDNIFNLTTYV